MVKSVKKSPKAKGANPKKGHSNARSAIGPLPKDDEQPAPPVRPGSAAAEKSEKRDPGTIPSHVPDQKPAALNDDHPGRSNPKTPRPSASRRVVAEDPNSLWDKISERMKEQVAELIDAHLDGIREAYEHSVEDWPSDKKFTYPVGFGSTITGDDPTHMTVRTKIAYSTKHTDDREDQVAVGKDLVDLMDAED